jgi:hypothetical protein
MTGLVYYAYRAVLYHGLYGSFQTVQEGPGKVSP